MSPVEIRGTPRYAESFSACVPLPAPGGPRRTRRMRVRERTWRSKDLRLRADVREIQARLKSEVPENESEQDAPADNHTNHDQRNQQHFPLRDLFGSVVAHVALAADRFPGRQSVRSQNRVANRGHR